MDTNLCHLALLIGPCPHCGNGRLDAVFEGDTTNFLCRDCGHCWHPEMQGVRETDPGMCRGCGNERVCRAASRPVGAGATTT